MVGDGVPFWGVMLDMKSTFLLLRHSGYKDFWHCRFGCASAATIFAAHGQWAKRGFGTLMIMIVYLAS